MMNFKAILACIKKTKKCNFLAMALVAVALSACSSDDVDVVEGDKVNTGSVAVKGFSLRKDNGVLHNLDSVFFSIDLNKARIYNADSLPYGTDISGLIAEISTTPCSKISLFMPNKESGEEEEHDWLNNQSMKIDFTKGPVKLQLVSYDGSKSRDYEIRMNVHKMKPDSLYWSETAVTALPTNFNKASEQKSVVSGNGKVYCYSTDGDKYCVSTTTDIYNNVWDKKDVSFPKSVNIRSLIASGDKLYILAADGELLTSQGDGMTWSGTGKYWNSIIATYSGERVLGVTSENGNYFHVTYPETTRTPVAEDFPLSGNSASVEFSTKWSTKSQVMTTGGRDASGKLSGDTWAYDGERWAKIGSSLKPAEGYAVTRYTISVTDTVSWRIKEQDVMLAFGGHLADGTINRDVFLSKDMGITWVKAQDFLQLPKYMPSVYNTDVLVVNTTFGDKNSAVKSSWRKMPVMQLPSLYRMPSSRAVTVPDTWQCPYIYMFGGIDVNGALQHYVWRGIVNHFSFRPLE